MQLPGLAVVSYAAHEPFMPRGIRTRALVPALERDWSVELYAGRAPSNAVARRRIPGERTVRAGLRRLSERVVLDKHEAWSYRHFRSWQPRVQGALLIGLPASPILYAAARLRDRKIPYVVDLGDPWVLTNADPRLRWPAAPRAAIAERDLWTGASGAVVTTQAVAEGIASLHPTLPILVRPNGYDPVQVIEADDNGTRSTDTLSLVHFGALYAIRVEVADLLGRLVQCGRWREVRFSQYGYDWGGCLERVPERLIVARHDPVPWNEAISVARNHDAAIVIGNQNPSFPSKAVQYLTLPVPRVAVTTGDENDSLAKYVADKPGWITLGRDDLQVADRLHAHLARAWTAADLLPPRKEAWPTVAAKIAEFVASVLSTAEAETQDSEAAVVATTEQR